MPRDLILGTAGHIDHGKTSLVKALTGIDCDRLPDEKRRGITIDIGFAHLDLGEIHLEIVDCPGHERFIKNMLAGSTGIDLALFMIAADDGIMPQTREHLEILRLLGLRHGVIALTKVDLVDESTRELVEMEIRELVEGTFLADSAIISTSVHSGQGIDQLKQALADECSQIVSRGGSEWFRLAIDRSFIVQGHGTVVTGSVTSGTLAVGDEIEWLPKGERVRVRSLQNHDHPVEKVHRGQRAAINLAGVSHEFVQRGQELATPEYLFPSRVLTVRLQTLAANRKPLKHRSPIRLHIGSAEVMGTLSLLEGDLIEPGQWGLAQLFLEEEVMGAWGQPFVVRDSSAEHTLGGGQILQPVATKIRRRHLESLDRIEKLWTGDPETRAGVVAWFTDMSGVKVADLVRGAGIAPDLAEQILQNLLQNQHLIEIHSPSQTILLHRDRLQELEVRLLQVVNRLHTENPLMTNHDTARVFAQLDYIGDHLILEAVVNRLLKSKQLVGDRKRIASAEFKPKLSANQRKLKERVIESHLQAGFTPPEPQSFAPQAGGNTANLKDIFEVAVAEGHLVKISEEIYLHQETEAQMRHRVREKLDSGIPGLTVAEIRDLLGTTRKFAIPLCEYLDRIGVTRREDDLRVRGPKSKDLSESVP